MTSRRDSRAARGLAVLLGLLADTSAGMAVLTVVPLVMLQMPNLMAAAVPSMIASLHAGTGGPASAGTPAELIRVAGLALPAMVIVTPAAAVAARRGGAWPVLLAGLALLGLADVGGNLVGARIGSPAGTAGSITGLTGGVTGLVAEIGLDRAGHGVGAGLAAAGALALLAERGGAARRLLACLWAAATVCTLVAAVSLIWPRLTQDGWRALLQPFPQLTGAALAVTAVHVALARGAALCTARAGPGSGGIGSASLARGPARRGERGRAERAPAERAQLAMLSVPVAGVAGLTIAASFGWVPRAQLAAGVLGAVVLAALATALSRDPVTGGGLCFPLVALAAGLVAAPSAGALAGLRPPAAASAAAGHGPLAPLLAVLPDGTASLPPAVAAAAALAGGLAGWLVVLSSRRLPAAPAAAVMAGLAATGAGLLLLQLGPHALGRTSAPPPEHTVAIVFGLVAGGLSLALGPALAEAPPGGALAGLALMLAGSLDGYLIAGAIRIGMLPAGGRAPGAAAVMHSLGGAARAWEIAAGWAAGTALLAVFLNARSQLRAARSRPSPPAEPARRATVPADRAG